MQGAEAAASRTCSNASLEHTRVGREKEVLPLSGGFCKLMQVSAIQAITHSLVWLNPCYPSLGWISIFAPKSRNKNTPHMRQRLTLPPSKQWQREKFTEKPKPIPPSSGKGLIFAVRHQGPKVGFLKFWMLEDSSQTKAARTHGCGLPWTPGACLLTILKILRCQAFHGRGPMFTVRCMLPEVGFRLLKSQISWDCSNTKSGRIDGSGWTWTPRGHF